MYKYGTESSQFYSLPKWQAVKLTLACTWLKVISASLQNNFKMSIDYSLSVIWIPPKHFTCPLDKFRTEFTSPTAKSTRHWLLSSTFFAYCKVQNNIMLRLK